MSVLRTRENENFEQGGSGAALSEFENPVVDTVITNLSHLLDLTTLKKNTVVSANPANDQEELAVDILQAKLLTDPALTVFSTFGLGGVDTGELANVDGETYSFRCEYWTLCADMSDRGIQLNQKLLSSLAFITKHGNTILKPGTVIEIDLVGKFAGAIITQAPLGIQEVSQFTPSIESSHKLFVLHLYATPITKQELSLYKESTANQPEAQEEWSNQLDAFLKTLETKAYSSRRAELDKSKNENK